ncbi:CRISPR-associated endonuclease Cas1 [Chitinispirillales bacterium ANBcel5]|uniref:CRISPR-associated endonuclease Cas1 n=1 Tax=Cellulosispirillum alkaliphilum TaxID=3039283 RepID=UPI002A51380D|nr:CRISPR-associated endonuclease Cas1 [Chitinispirillales bacterium ANBcel5]
MSFLYITEQGAYIKKKGGHIQVIKNEEVLVERVIREIKCLVLFGGVHPTTDATLALLNSGCDIAYMTKNGHFKGRLVSAAGKNSILRAGQYAMFHDPKVRLAFARRYVIAKIRNGMAVLSDYHHSGKSEFVFDERSSIEEICEHIATRCNDLASLFGYEGAAARHYFGAFARLLTHGRAFPGRIFHPSTDPVNALLSFGYSFVARELQGILEALGLDPYIGFFHEVTYGRASLTLDLMEEFRHPFIDRLVVRLFNKRMLGDDDFETGDKGQVYLKKESLKIFIRHYEEWANRVNRTLGDDGELSWRQVMWKQGEKLRRAVEYNEEYTPFSWKEGIKEASYSGSGEGAR